MNLHGLPDNYLNERVSKIYGVSPDQVKEIASKYLDPEKMMIVVVGDKSKTKPQIEEFKKADYAYKKMLD